MKNILGDHAGQYLCKECGLQYASPEWAEKCEAWCKEYNSCNLEITSHSEENISKKENYE